MNSEISNLPLPGEFRKSLLESSAPAGLISTTVNSCRPRSFSDLNQLLRWVDAVLDGLDTKALMPIHPEAHADAASLWFFARLAEQQGKPQAIRELLTRPELASADPELDAFRLVFLARALFGLGEHNESALTLRRAIKLTDSPSLLRKASLLAQRLVKTGKIQLSVSCRLALLGDVTFTDYQEPLRAFAFANQFALELHSGAYGQISQQLLDPASELAAFRPSVIVFAQTWRSLGLSEEEADPDFMVERAISGCKENWERALAMGCDLVIQHNFEVPETSAFGRLSAVLPGGRGRILQRINLALHAAAVEFPGVAILDLDFLAASFGKHAWNDARLWFAAKQYPSTAGAIFLARHQMALIKAVYSAPAKCLVVDLDNTLWGGVIGEDGVAGIRLGGSGEGEAFVDFQQYLKSLASRGIILAVCSKNDEVDAKKPFLEHPEMVLRLTDFSAFVANWRTKPENLSQIAADLNIGLDSIVFIDDNPAERMAVRAALPEVEVPEVGSESSEFAARISRSLAFEALTITREDRSRVESYRTESARKQLRNTMPDLDDYLAGLGMTLSLAPVDVATMPRVVQLLGKTNQFNLTTSRFTEKEVQGYCGREGYARTVRLADQFTDHGLTGVLLAKAHEGALSIDEWVLSCRILGRRVEDAMFAAIWNYAVEAGFTHLRAAYRRSQKNSQVAELYSRLGMGLERESQDMKWYSAPLRGRREMPACFTSILEPTGAIPASVAPSGEVKS